MKSKKAPRPRPKDRRFWIVAGVAILALALFAIRASRDRKSAAAPAAQMLAAIVPPEAETFAQYAGSATCRDCHATAYEHWSASNHGLAERPVREELDATAFDPARTFTHGSQKTEVRKQGGKCEVVALGFGGKVEPYPIERVIGHEPLRQFLVGAPGGRLQTLEASYDPAKNEWFNVYGNEDRQPGEWGHWTGRGMSWNAMCAGCHNTRVRKNYDAATDAYRTTMAEATVSCESCHGPMKAHVDWRKKYPASTEADPTLRQLTRDQAFDACGTCHARRSELTGDFHPGEKFSDHHGLTVVDETDTYFADGQVSGENYEYGSFLGSKMHAAGVRCTDCHDPHRAQPKLQGNALCLTCHAGAVPPHIMKIPAALDPIAHSHHQAGSAGEQCVSCHMPVTTYMQRDPRHDHGFTIPDPLLTKTHGIPNACNRCHVEKDADWALATVEQWYGPKMDRPTRERAQAVVAARRGDEAGRAPLLKVAEDNSSPYWQASAAHLLTQWIAEPQVSSLLIKQTLHPSPLVRAAAANALEAVVGARPDAREFVGKLLDDDDRSVRVAAAWTLRDTLVPGTRADGELRHHLALNADQPAGQMQAAAFEMARNNAPAAVEHLRRAIAWDPNSPPFRHELAVALSTIGDNAGALEQLEAAVKLDPKQAEYRYKLALACNESGRLDRTVAELQTAVTLDPRHARAWYNLGLARNSLGQTEAALAALARGETAAPRDPRIPYARATILAQLGRTAEARQAAQRALQVQPGYGEARALLQNLQSGK
jgi:predicted CXXCH cytochrome family protein